MVYARAGKRTLQGGRDVETNDLGEYRFYGLAKGHYLVRATMRERRYPIQDLNAGDGDSSVGAGYSPVYYPGTADETRAVAISVDAGQEVPAINFTLIPIRSFRLRGHVFDATLGQAPKDCMVLLIHRDPGSPSSYSNEQGQTNCQKGTFEFNSVPSGSYFVVAEVFGDGKIRTARASLDVSETNVDDIGVVLARGTNLTGHLTAEGTQALDPSELYIWLSDPNGYDGDVKGAEVKPVGTLLLENVPEGNYQIGLYGRPPGFSPDFYIKDAIVNGESVLDRGLAIPAAGSQRSIEIVMSSAGVRVDGTVTDENDLPAPGAVVALVPEDGRRRLFRLYKNSATDQYGKFILRGIAPGK